RYIGQSARAPFLMAERLGLGKIDYCIDAAYDNGSNKRNGTGNGHAFIFARFNGKIFVKWSTGFPNWVSNTGRAWDLYSIFTQYWGGSCGVQSDFERAPNPCGGGAVPGPLITTFPSGSDQVVSDTISQVESKLRAHQQALYGRIVAEFSNTGRVNSAARVLRGVKGLLSAYASLLLPRTMEENDYISSLLAGG